MEWMCDLRVQWCRQGLGAASEGARAAVAVTFASVDCDCAYWVGEHYRDVLAGSWWPPWEPSPSSQAVCSLLESAHCMKEIHLRHTREYSSQRCPLELSVVMEIALYLHYPAW